MTFHKVKCLAEVSHPGPSGSNYTVEAALIALPVCGPGAVSQDLLVIYWPTPSGQTNITRPSMAINHQCLSRDVLPLDIQLHRLSLHSD